jgi:Flp pilus assembly protein TadG
MRAQKGQAIVLIAIMLAVLVGMAALAIDGSRAYAARRDLQAAVDSAALAAADKLQQGGTYTAAEQAATAIFGTNLRLYAAPGCAGYGSPGAGPLTVTCNFSDGTILTQVVSSLGPQGSRFSLFASRLLQLDFAKILTNGGSPTITGTASGGVNNLLFTPAIAALSQAGCGGAGGAAISVNGSGTLNVNGDVVANGSITVSGSTLRVAGDIYARCQGSVGGATSACYPSGVSTPCSYPDVAGATRSGFRLADPAYPGPSSLGGSQGAPGSNVVLQPGTYAGNPNFNSRDCWFLSGGVYDWQAGYTNSLDLVSNELKPPDEPVVGSTTSVSTHQFWNTDGVNCAGSVQVSNVDNGDPNPLDAGNWGVVVTSVRTDVYGGVSYLRESAPSACQSVHVHNGEVLQVQVSNVPGAMSYNVYLSNLNNGCNGPWGWAGNIPVTGTVSNNNTAPCPAFNGNGCTLGHTQQGDGVFDSANVPDTFGPSVTAAPDTYESYVPAGETAPLGANLPNSNPPQGAGSAGDRANERNCESIAGSFVTCPGPITPGAVEFYIPSGCVRTTSGDTYVFSGFQYDWLSVYEPPANACLSNTLGGAANSAYVGLVYAPSAAVAVTSAYAFEVAATGGVLASTVSFTGTLPSIIYSASYAPVPPASRLTG